MNIDLYKELPLGAKIQRLYANKFILNEEDHASFMRGLEDGELRTPTQAARYIDEHGEWLD